MRAWWAGALRTPVGTLCPPEGWTAPAPAVGHAGRCLVCVAGGGSWALLGHWSLQSRNSSEPPPRAPLQPQLSGFGRPAPGSSLPCPPPPRGTALLRQELWCQTEVSRSVSSEGRPHRHPRVSWDGDSAAGKSLVCRKMAVLCGGALKTKERMPGEGGPSHGELGGQCDPLTPLAHQGRCASKLTRVPPTPARMAASVCPSRPRTSAAARPASMAQPAGRTSTSAARTRGPAATAAPASTRSAPTTARAAPHTPAPTASCPSCPAAPPPARTGAPAAPRGTPPTSAPACQVLPAGLGGQGCGTGAPGVEGCRPGWMGYALLTTH